MIIKIGDQITAVIAKLAEKNERYRDALRTALYQECNSIMRVAIKQTPVDTGKLRSSAYVSIPTKDFRPTIRMSFGTEYGVYVHERTDLTHKPPTKDHFLSDAMNDAKMGLKDRLIRKINLALASNNLMGDTPSYEEPLNNEVQIGIGARAPKTKPLSKRLYKRKKK